jgi:hypothetical protein
MRIGEAGQAAQEKLEVEMPELPSYSMPKALMLERLASAALNSDEAG